MKNLNEQIERINNLSNYVVGVVISEQELDYWDLAKKLDMNMQGFVTKSGKDRVASILNQIDSESGWKEIQRTYGNPNGKNLLTRLKEFLGADYSKIIDPLMLRIKDKK